MWITPHTPGFIQQITQKFGLDIDKRNISLSPETFEDATDIENLIDYIIDPERRLPIFIFTLTENRRTAINDVTLNVLNKALLGVGYLALLHPEAAWKLTDRFGKKKSVFDGAARVYLPGFSDNADPYTHRLILANRLNTPENITQVTDWMRRLAAHESILRTRIGDEVLSFATVHDTNLQLRQQNLQNTNASTNDQLAAANERIEALKEQVISLKKDQDTYIEEWGKELQRADTAEYQLHISASRIQYLTNALKSKKIDPDEDIAFPDHWADLLDWCGEHLVGRLVLTPKARHNALNANFTDVTLVAKCLFWLANEYRDKRIHGGGTSLNNIPIPGIENFRNASCGSDTYRFKWENRDLSANWHIKNGGNTRDPSLCLRIYYCFDDETQQIVVDDLPAHRRTDAT
ncbi:hypothetical protein PT277_07745 [Acetobacteraceae bacterium ESL0709]|nr:hypothetical protein [Acetobacteraceae bacterium ESL0697]MDF7678571.1 hypothetical protein [Acetobacteraceae bacterium ESL0709]